MDFNKYVDDSKCIVFVLDDNDGKVLYANNIFRKSLDDDNVVGKYCEDIMNLCIRKYFNDEKYVQIENKIGDNYYLINGHMVDNVIFCVGVDITDIKNYNNNIKIALSELSECKRKAEMSDLLKSSFLANVSHEIRTPLNSITGYSRLLGRSFISRTDKKKYIDIIDNSSRKLIDIIDDIIDLSKIESNDVIINNDKCVLCDIIKNVYNKYKDDVSIGFYYDELTNVVIYTDCYRLNQILNNLVSNAIKFTKNGYVRFGYILEQKHIKFFVEDTGIGIDSNNFDYIFERFTQLDEKDSKQYGGTGLGLSITKKLVELLGGKIWLESKLGEGTTFYFTIPSDYHQKILNEYDNINKYGKIKMEWGDKNILIVDDDEYCTSKIKNILLKTNINIKIISSGLESIKELKSNNYDIILIDIKLPDINSYDLVSKLRISSNLPIIMMIPFVVDKNELFMIGIDDYIIKPIETNKLLMMLNKYLN